jgi:hypothetical protein
MENFHRKRPMGVTRGSSGILKAVLPRVEVGNGRLQFFCIVAHGAKLIEQEPTAVQAAPHLPEKHGPG